MQAGQCDNQMSAKFWEVVCGENGIGSGGEYCGVNDSQLSCFDVLYHEASAALTFPARCSWTSNPPGHVRPSIRVCVGPKFIAILRKL
jgi:hypothetical protein